MLCMKLKHSAKIELVFCLILLDEKDGAVSLRIRLHVDPNKYRFNKGYRYRILYDASTKLAR